MSADVKTDVKQQEIKELLYYSPFLKKYLQNLKYPGKQTCIFHLVFLGIFHPTWYCPLRTGDWGFAFNRQNLLNKVNVICWQSVILIINFSLLVAFRKFEWVLTTYTVIYNNCSLKKQFGIKILSDEFSGGNILMPLVIIKSSLGPVKSHNMFNQGNVQKNDTKAKSQDICQELTVTRGHTKVLFFLRHLKDSWKYSNNRMVYAISLW